MRIRYGHGADAAHHDTIYVVRYGYGTDTVRHETIHWFAVVMAPSRLIGFAVSSYPPPPQLSLIKLN